jgi:deazaflavin-dependent oxidoreductase (nitroreductase family)
MKSTTDFNERHEAPRLKVPWFMPLFNAVSRPLLKAGVPLAFNGLITVAGRKTGLPRMTPVAIIQMDDRRWVWAPWGEVDWVRNLRAAGKATVTLRRHKEEVTATELDPTEREGFFRDVLTPLSKRFPGGYWFLRLADGVDLHKPEEIARDRRVFELRPTAAR